MSNFKITVLPGDGIGVDVTREAVACLQTIGQKFGHEFAFEEHLMGGAALDKVGVPLPDETLTATLASDAVLLGAVGAPQYDNNPPKLKPETGLLALRAGLGVFANLRPAFLHETLIDASPLKADIVRGTDLLIVRELMGGAYFGQPRGVDDERGWNTMAYTAPEVERVARVAFEEGRQGLVCVAAEHGGAADALTFCGDARHLLAYLAEMAADFFDLRIQSAYGCCITVGHRILPRMHRERRSFFLSACWR